jgi:hypothetical protein
MATAIAAEANEMVRIRGEVGNSGIDNPARLLHELGEVRTPTDCTRALDREPQPYLDQMADLQPRSAASALARR